MGIIRYYLALWISKISATIIKVVSPSRGSNLSGSIALAIDPLFVRHMKNIDPNKTVFITGTNGKSTTNNLINHVLKENGIKTVSNLEGANLLGGIATAFIKSSTLSGRTRADYYIFETDERFIPLIREQLPAANILITNLQKDQVQRNGDPDFIIRHLKRAFKSGIPRLFINNEEPRASSFAEYADQIVRFGVEEHAQSFRKGEDYITMPCPRCRHKIEFRHYNTDGIGPFRCRGCGFESSKSSDYIATNADFEKGTFRICGVDFNMPYNMPYMLYNYAACVAVAHEMCGISVEDCAKAFDSFKNVGGRFEVLHYKGKTIKYMRTKQENPETFQTSINIIAADPSRKMVALGLAPVADFVPHYTNTFYAYDCDFSRLVQGDVERYFCFTDVVCYDVANRLIYEGVERDIITIEENEEPEVIFREIEAAETDNIYLITLLRAYENMEKWLRKEGAEIE